MVFPHPRGATSHLLRGRAGPGGPANLTTEAGYYDQSYMTAEFRSVMGVSPGRFAEVRLPPPGTCSGLVT